MSVRREQGRAIGLARQVDIGHEAAAAGEKAAVFDTPDRAADAE